MRDVRVALDMNNTSDQLLATGDIDTLTLEEIIRSKIVEGVRSVESVAPVNLLTDVHDLGTAVYWDGGGNGHLLLPDDFMRMVIFQMSDWERPVYEAFTYTDPNYVLQSSRYKGIRGNTQKPVCVLGLRPEGRVLEFYSCKDETADVKMGTYLPYPEEDMDGGIDICPLCYNSIVYEIAALVASTYGQADKASLYTELSKNALI